MEDKTTSIMSDPRPIDSISWGLGGNSECYRVGHGSPDRKVTDIRVYREAGQFNYIPWVAICVGGEVIARADCSGATIRYE